MKSISEWFNRSGRVWARATSVAMVALACGPVEIPTDPDATDERIPAFIIVSPGDFTAVEGDTVRFEAMVTNARGKPLPDLVVSWASSDTSIVRISADGRAISLDTGSVTISARIATIEQPARLSVRKRAIASIVVTPSPTDVSVGGVDTLSATPLASNGKVLSGRSMTWASGNPSIATVNQSGVVVARNAGQTLITVTSEGVLGSAVINVAALPLPGVVTDLRAVSATDSSLVVDFTQVPDNGGGAASYIVRYAIPPFSAGGATTVTRGSCASPVIGTVVGAPLSCSILGLAPATSYVVQVVAFRGTFGSDTVQGPGSNLVTTSTSLAPVSSVSLSPASLTLQVGANSGTLAATLRDAAGSVLTGRAISWVSSNPAVASVSGAGIVSPAAAGSTTITATSEGRSAVATVTVAAAPAAPPGTVANFAVASTTDTTAILSFTEVSDGLGAPASYDVRVAVAPLSWGTATTVTAGTCATPLRGVSIGATLSCSVRGLTPGTAYQFRVVAFRGTLNVNAVFGGLSNIASGTTRTPTPPPATVSTVTVTPGSANGQIGESISFVATPRDAAGNAIAGRTASWSSSNTAVATVSTAGVVSAVSAGTASIRGNIDGVVGTALITVTAPIATGGGTILFRDGFENGSFSLTQNGVRWTDRARVDNSSVIARSGSRSARFMQGTPLGDGSWSELRFGGLPQLTEVFIEFYLYMPDGSEVPSVGPKVTVLYPGGNDKFFRLWANTYGQPPEVGASTWSRAGGIGSLGREYFYTYDNGTVMGMGQGPDPVPPLVPLIIDSNKGRWVQIRIRAKVSGPDNRSGVIQMWADGVLVGNDTALHNYPPNGTNNYYANGYLLGWANSGYTPGQMMYIDDVTISTGGFVTP